MATPLHNHTHFSALDGLSKPDEIAEAAIKCGFEAAACTDHGLVAGHLEFYDAMQDKGLRPVLGMESYQAIENRRLQERREDFHLLLLATNTRGLRNLWALSTEAYETGFYHRPRVDWDLLSKYSEGMVCTSACLGGILSQSLIGPPEMPEEKITAKQRLAIQAKIDLQRDIPSPEKLIEKYQSIFRDNFFIEIHTYESDLQASVNFDLVQLARQFSVPLVYANDAHYAYRDQFALHEAVLKLTINSGRKNAEEEGRRYVHPQCLYIMSEEEVRDRLSYLPEDAVDEAVKNSDEIARRCSYDLPDNQRRTPIFLPEKPYQTNSEMFMGLVQKGFKEKVEDWDVPGWERDPEVYFDRLQREIRTIFAADLVDYFLIVADYVRKAESMNVIVGPGRGSAGGSLVAYVFGITDVDPIRYGLIFERFYNAGREKGMPDIDIDFNVTGREKVKEYVAKKYKPDCVGDLGTVGRMGPKLAIKDMGRVLKADFTDLEKISKILDSTIESGLWNEWEEILEQVGDELGYYIDKYPKLFEYAEALMGKSYGDHHSGYVRTYGIHASAVIVGNEPLASIFPLRWVAKQKKMVSQWDMHAAERFGFMKMDFLGLTQLEILDVLDGVLVKGGKPPLDRKAIQYMEHPEEMWKLLDKGLVTGIFQMDASGMAKKLCKQVRPRSVDDLGLIVATNRPGPLIAGSDQKIVAGREGEPVSYLNEVVERVTTDTWGEFIYQEQVIHFLTEIGYTLTEADTVRKNMGKKYREIMLKEKARFMEHAVEHMPEVQAEAVWNIMEPFSKYAFNKSHAIQYGLITLWSLYAKYHYPAEYMVAGIIADEKKNRGKWIMEAQRMGIEVFLPDINKAGVYPEVVDGTIMLGLNDIKNIGLGTAKWIVQNRPYDSYEHFVAKTKEDERKIRLPNGTKKVAVTTGGESGGQGVHLSEAGCFESLEPRQLAKSKRIEIEEKYFDVALSDDSDLIVESWPSIDETINISSVNGYGLYVLAGVIRDIRERRTKKGDPMAFVKLVRDNDEIEFAVWADHISKYHRQLQIRTPVVVEIKRTPKGTHLERLAEIT